MRDGRAFSLVELLIVIVVVAVLAVVLLVSGSGVIDRYGVMLDVQRLQSLDAASRSHAARVDAGVLRFDLEQNQARYVPDGEQGSGAELFREFQADILWIEVHGRRFDREVEIRFNSLGLSDSYTLGIGTGDHHVMLSVLGGSGMSVQREGR